MSTPKNEWWFPVLCDEAYFVRLRADYPEHADWSDEALLSRYNHDRKYQFLADHVDDAYSQFEALADAYLALLSKRATDGDGDRGREGT